MGHWSHYRHHSFCPSNPKENHTPISQRSQLRSKEVKQFSQGHTPHAVWPWRTLSFISYYLSEEPACLFPLLHQKKKSLDLVKSLYYRSLRVSSFQCILKDQYFWHASIINYKGDWLAKGLWRLNVASHHLWESHQESLNNLGSEPFWKGAKQTFPPQEARLIYLRVGQQKVPGTGSAWSLQENVRTGEVNVHAEASWNQPQWVRNWPKAKYKIQP